MATSCSEKTSIWLLTALLSAPSGFRLSYLFLLKKITCLHFTISWDSAYNQNAGIYMVKWLNRQDRIITVVFGISPSFPVLQGKQMKENASNYGGRTIWKEVSPRFRLLITSFTCWFAVLPGYLKNLGLASFTAMPMAPPFFLASLHPGFFA